MKTDAPSHFVPDRSLALLLISLGTLTGCVTRGYKLAPKNAPPATVLNLSATPVATQQTAEATLRAVIVYQGPGSWKREAYWDEYVVAIANRSDAPLTIASATLFPTTGDPVMPGDNPWAIEKYSKRWWQSNAARQGGTYLALGAGATVGVGVAYASAMSSIMTSAGSGTLLAGEIGAAAFVTLPVVAIGTAFANLHSKHKVEAEFARRRLALPLTIAPGAAAQGSLFFRVTPAPRQLVLACRVAEAACDLRFDLSPLAGLHLRQPPGAPPVGSPPPPRGGDAIGPGNAAH